jgi:pyocin large subunit-like protein
MRTYKFGVTNSWLDHREPTADLWKAYLNNTKNADEVLFVYEDGYLVGSLDCSLMWRLWNKSEDFGKDSGRDRFIEFLTKYIEEHLK